MKKYFSFTLVSILLLAYFITGTALTVCNAAMTQHVFDDAGLLTERERTSLEDDFDSFSTSAKIDIVCITTYDTEGKTDKRYIEDFFDDYYDNKKMISEDAAIMLINMTAREITIQGYGKCEFYISNDRIEYMLDDIQPLLSNADYSDALLQFATECEYYMGEEKGVSTEYKPGQDYGEAYAGPSNYYGHEEEKPFYLSVWFIILVSLVIGGIFIFIMIRNAGGKTTVNSRTYLDPNSPGLTGQYDNYIRTSVTRTKHVESTGGGGGGRGRSSGGGGRSRGGHSHSGGSRGF